MNNRKAIAKRNVRKLNPNTSTHIAKVKTLKSNGWGRYNFPRCDEVPAGIYFSEVKKASFTKTRANIEAIEVFYELKDGITCWKIANGFLPPEAINKSFYVKQIYPVGTSYYEDFVDSMSESLGYYDGEEFTLEEIIGITEYVKISYDSYNSDLGGIKSRCPMNWEEFIQLNTKKKTAVSYEEDCEESIEEVANDPENDYVEAHETESSEPYTEIHENPPAKEVDDDDEFDDFFENFDDWDD